MVGADTCLQGHKNPLGRLARPAGLFQELGNLTENPNRLAVWSEATKTLGRFDQLHPAIAFAMQHLHAAFRIAKDKHLAVTKFSFLHRLFQCQGLV